MKPFVLIILISIPSFIFGQPFPLGEYETISESEWMIRINFQAQGKLTIYVSSWLPGKYENRETKIIDGSWEAVDNFIMVKYDETSEKLKYFDL